MVASALADEAWRTSDPRTRARTVAAMYAAADLYGPDALLAAAMPGTGCRWCMARAFATVAGRHTPHLRTFITPRER